MGNLSTPNNLPTTLRRNPPCSSRSFSHLPTWEESWAKATKPFAIMSIYKISILFLDGQGILITSSISNNFPPMIRRIIVFHTMEISLLLRQGNSNQN